MGQQPNIELVTADLPRPVPVRGPERRWRPQRPGDIGTPGDMPWGGAFGTTGPDAGFAMVLIRRRHLDLAEGEHRHNVEAGIAALAAARASHFGRAPMEADVDVAVALLGYHAEGMPAEVIADLARRRIDWFANIGHDARRSSALVASVPEDVLFATPDEVRRRMAAGEQLITR